MGLSSPPPESFLGNPVPDHIAVAWNRWEGAVWRRNQHWAANNLFPPDQRFSVRFPDGMCSTHRKYWIGYRNMIFDPVTGDRWPGGGGSMFTVIGHDLNRVREERRTEWDEKASEQMQQIERICLSGRSPQCDRETD